MKELGGAKLQGSTAVVSSEKPKLNHKKKKKQKRNDMDSLASSHAHMPDGMNNVEGRGEEILKREDVDTKRCQSAAKEESPIALEKLQGKLDPSSHPYENEVHPLDAE